MGEQSAREEIEQMVANAWLCMDVGGDYWIRQGASFDDQWRHNSDIAIGYYKKITSDWQYVYMTTCPQDWDKGFPCDKQEVVKWLQ